VLIEVVLPYLHARALVSVNALFPKTRGYKQEFSRLFHRVDYANFMDLCKFLVLLSSNFCQILT
jgi:hypothetical protein